MDNNKVSGPDGYNALFFKKAWNIIRDDIFAVVNEFFMSGKLLKQINHALIALIQILIILPFQFFFYSRLCNPLNNQII